MRSFAALLFSSPPASDRANRVAWLFCLVVSFCHIVSLPLLVTYDSNWYVRLADILGTAHFPGEWDFLRTPLFPAMLKFAFWLLGRQAMAVFALQACLACGGIWLLSGAVRALGFPVASAVGIVVLATFPTLIAYEHILLTEVGSFFFLALLVSLLARPKPVSFKSAIMLAVAIAAGYYYRSSLLYLAPLCGAIYVVKGLKQQWRDSDNARQRSLLAKRLGPQFLIIALGPFLIAYPWQRNPAITARNGQSVILFGLIKQGVLPLNDPALGTAAPEYKKAIEDSKSHGVLPNEGLTNGRELSIVSQLYPYGPVADSIFVRAVRSDPQRYLAAVWRNVTMFSEFGSDTYYNAVLRHVVFYATTSEIDPGPPWIAPLGNEFKSTTARSFTERILRKLCPVFDWLVRLGLLATVAGGLLGLWRQDSALLAFTLPILAFMAIHALLLMSQDRMILPVQPILLFNLVLLPAWLRTTFIRRYVDIQEEPHSMVTSAALP